MSSSATKKEPLRARCSDESVDSSLPTAGRFFLDEIGEIEPEVQVRLLRVLQEREFERLGSGETIATNVRVIVATHRDLAQDVQAGRFREDLYYRLNVFPISIPPLRERAGDLELLADYFLKKFAKKIGRKSASLSSRALASLRAYRWPGNVRELENVLERAVILCEKERVDFGPEFVLGGRGQLEGSSQDESLEAIQKRHILRVLERTAWQVEGDGGAAKVLGLHPNTLRSRMKKLAISRSAETP